MKRQCLPCIATGLATAAMLVITPAVCSAAARRTPARPPTAASLATIVVADASYKESTQITGGALVDQLKQVSFLSKKIANLTAPTVTQTMVHGNQKAVVSKDSMEIYDLDKETVTRVDLTNHTYSVVTFAQMRKMFEDMPKELSKIQQPEPQPAHPVTTDLQTSFDVSVKNTGATRMVNGFSAQEQMVVLTVKVTDPKAPPTDGVNSVAYTVTTDAWIAPDPPELKEIHDFDVRMGKKLMAGVDMSAWAASMKSSVNPAMAALLGNKPGAAEAMAHMAKEMEKIKGTRLMEITTMGGTATGAGVGAAPAAAAAGPPPTAGSVAGQAATDTASGESSRLGAFGSALSNSALGAFRRKKATPPPAAPAATPAATPGTPGTASMVLMEMTAQKQNFSEAPIAISAFQVPAGFRQVESPYMKMGK